MLVAGSGAMGKNKAIVCELSTFASAPGMTSNFGDVSDINSTSVEYLSLEKQEKSENETEEFQTNMRTLKDNTATDAWDDWSGMEVWNDADNTNWKAFVAAQETDATGTITLKAGTKTIGSWEAKVSKAGGGGGDASSFDTGFTPTFTLIRSLDTGAV